MANRNYNKVQALEKEVKKIYVRAAIGAVGAPTLNAVDSKGVASIARVSAGRYLVTLQDKYSKLLSIVEHRQLAAGAPSAVGGMVVRAEAVASAGTVTIEFLDAVGAAVELASGTVLRLSLELKNSSV